MSEITKDYIEKELKKIAFFVQHSGLFEDFAAGARDTLEGLGIDWDSVETKGSVKLKWQDEPVWRVAELKGTLNDNPIKMDISRDSSRNKYSVVYNGKKAEVSSLNALEDLIESFKENKEPKPEKLQKIHEYLKRNKSGIYRDVKPYLSQASAKPWKTKLYKGDRKRISMRFHIDAEDGAEKEGIKNHLEQQDYYRVNAVRKEIEQHIKKLGYDIRDFEVTQRFIDMPNQIGFTISIQ